MNKFNNNAPKKSFKQSSSPRENRGSTDANQTPNRRLTPPSQGPNPPYNYRKNQGGQNNFSNYNRNKINHSSNPNNLNNENKIKEALEKQYETLQQNLIDKRRQLYDQYYRCDLKYLPTLEKNYHQAQENIYAFLKNLSPKERELLKNKIDPYPLDQGHELYLKEQNQNNQNIEQMTFSQNISIPAPFPLGNLSPHFETIKGISEDLKGDKEESVGSMEDYYLYRNSNGKKY